MTTPPGHEDLIQRLGGALLELAPDGWRRIDLVSAGAHALTVVMGDGAGTQVEVPQEVDAALGDLRALLDKPWLSARFSVDPPGAIFFNYNFDYPADATPPVDPVARAAGPHEVLKGLSTWLIHQLPAEWEQLLLTVRAADGAMEARVVTVLDATLAWTAPAGVAEFFLELRRAGDDDWTSVDYHLVHPGRFNAEYGR